MTVVVGSATVHDASKDAHQVIALAVPSSVISMRSISPSTGFPDRFVVNDVIACASPVICATLTILVLIVGVADWVTIAAILVSDFPTTIQFAPSLAIVYEIFGHTGKVVFPPIVSLPFPSNVIMPVPTFGIIYSCPVIPTAVGKLTVKVPLVQFMI